MECNRDESLRAKSIAEQKIINKDFTGAKKFALKAETLYPKLDGITQILTMLDVYISAENRISGETDWFGVLGVSPSSDDESIRKQYRKLALKLHPDKNKSVGADGAFNLISEAWSLLSDKAKRLAYNQRRGSRGFQQKVQMHAGGPSAPSQANGAFNSSKTRNNVAKPKPKPKPKPPLPTPAPNTRSDTFWTICLRCKMHYEYLKMYLNNTLLCPNCHKAFTAMETAPPYDFSKSSNQDPPRQQQHQHHSSNHVRSQNSHDPVRNAPKSGLGSDSLRYSHGKANSVGSTDPSIAAKAASVIQQAQNKVKRAYNESHRPAGLADGCVKKTKLDDNNNYNSRYGTTYYNTSQVNNSSFGISNGGGEGASGSRFYGFSNINRRPNSTRDLTMAETRTMLMAKSRKQILNTLRHSEKTRTTEAVAKEEKDTTKESRDENGTTEGPTDASMSVPDPDFHDFDEDRNESSFGDNEVWAAYDDEDGMPRFYAMISKVISKNPFKVKMSWLNSKTTAEFGSLDWVGSGFYKTCGEFWVGRYETCKSINAFSQKVKWAKSPRGSIMILPRKGDVWALYKNWSPNWTETTPDDVIHKYEMVMVLDDYDEGIGVNVAPLLKVLGFKTIFRPSVGPEAVRRVPKEEMLRFSHRVPNYLLTGLEGSNAPKGCLELDPAAMSVDLLQVMMSEGNDVPTVASCE